MKKNLIATGIIAVAVIMGVVLLLPQEYGGGLLGVGNPTVFISEDSPTTIIEGKTYYVGRSSDFLLEEGSAGFIDRVSETKIDKRPFIFIASFSNNVLSLDGQLFIERKYEVGPCGELENQVIDKVELKINSNTLNGVEESVGQSVIINAKIRDEINYRTEPDPTDTMRLELQEGILVDVTIATNAPTCRPPSPGVFCGYHIESPIFYIPEQLVLGITEEPDCVIDSDCATNEECIGEMCVVSVSPPEEPDCVIDSDCLADEECLSGVCTVITAPVEIITTPEPEENETTTEPEENETIIEPTPSPTPIVIGGTTDDMTLVYLGAGVIAVLAILGIFMYRRRK